MDINIESLEFVYWLEKYLPELQFKQLGTPSAFLKHLKLIWLQREKALTLLINLSLKF